MGNQDSFPGGIDMSVELPTEMDQGWKTWNPWNINIPHPFKLVSVRPNWYSSEGLE